MLTSLSLFHKLTNQICYLSYTQVLQIQNEHSNIWYECSTVAGSLGRSQSLPITHISSLSLHRGAWGGGASFERPSSNPKLGAQQKYLHYKWKVSPSLPLSICENCQKTFFRRIGWEFWEWQNTCSASRRYWDQSLPSPPKQTIRRQEYSTQDPRSHCPSK